MPSTPDHDVKGAATPSPLRVFIVSGDNVATVLAGRLFERLGHPRPERLAAFPEAAALRARADVLLVDADLEDAGAHAATWMQAGEGRPRIIAMSAGAADIRADAHLRKPLTMAALSAALVNVAVAGTSSGDDVGVVVWAALRQQFGDDGAAQLVGALVDDLPVQQQRMASAIRDSDLAGFKRVAHAMRGVGLQLEIATLVQLCAEAEKAARDARADTAIELGVRLIRQYELLVERLRDEAGKR